jgi:uncharacterized protein with PIN domain
MTTTEQIDGNIDFNSFEYGNDLKYIVDNSLPGVAKHLRILGIDTLFDKDYSQNYVMFLARRDSRILLTGSIKCVKAVNLVHDNHTRRKNKMAEYEKMLEVAIQREKNSNAEQNDAKSSGLIFSHEVNKWKPLNSQQIRERMEMLADELEDDTNAYQYKYYHVKVRGRDAQLLDVVNKFKIRYIKEKMFTRCTSCNSVVDRIPVEDKHIIQSEVDQSTYDENDHFAKCSGCGKITWGTEDGNLRQKLVYEKAVNFCQKFSYHPAE